MQVSMIVRTAARKNHFRSPQASMCIYPPGAGKSPARDRLSAS